MIGLGASGVDFAEKFLAEEIQRAAASTATRQDFIDLVKHWNQNYQFEETEGNNKDINIEEDLLKLAPSEKLFNAAVSLKNKNQVFDYGCGSGWASIIAAYKGCEKIISVDVIPNGCKLTNYYARAFKVNDRIQIVN